MQIELQWQAQEVLFQVAADLLDQAQGLAVAAEQQMLAVIQLGALVDYPACAPAKLPGALEHGDGDAALRQRDRCRHAGVAATDDGSAGGQFLSHVLKASHNLYPTPSETRSFSTWQPLGTTSSSVVR